MNGSVLLIGFTWFPKGMTGPLGTGVRGCMLIVAALTSVMLAKIPDVVARAVAERSCLKVKKFIFSSKMYS